MRKQSMVVMTGSSSPSSECARLLFGLVSTEVSMESTSRCDMLMVLIALRCNYLTEIALCSLEAKFRLDVSGFNLRRSSVAKSRSSKINTAYFTFLLSFIFIRLIPPIGRGKEPYLVLESKDMLAYHWTRMNGIKSSRPGILVTIFHRRRSQRTHMPRG